jgi:hypothetical protein
MEMGRAYGTYTVCAEAKVPNLLPPFALVLRKKAYVATITRLTGVMVPPVTGTINITSADPAGAC